MVRVSASPRTIFLEPATERALVPRMAEMTTATRLPGHDHTVPLAPPPHRGRLWYDDEISEQFFRGRVTVRWIREHLPHAKGIKIGREWAWYEADINEWIDARRGTRRAV